MSKRTAEFQINKDNPNDDRKMNNEAPSRATAAQLANRKIKSMPKRRGASPAAAPTPSTSNAFNSNPNPSFGFGSTQQPQQPQQQPNMFPFGAQPAQEASQSFPPTNGVSGNDTITNKSFGGFGGGFGNSVANNAGASTGGSMFGGFTAPSANSFNFSSSTTANPFSSLATGPAAPAAPAANPSTFSFGASTAVANTQASPFSFGSTAAPSQTPPTSFTTSQPAFSFGTSRSNSAEPPNSPSAEPIKSPFTFGQSASTSQTPVFGSTRATSASPQPATTASSPASNNIFASKYAPASNSISSVFGNQTTNTSTAPATSPFKFGSSTPEPVAHAGSSRETTPNSETATTKSPAPTTSNLFNFGATTATSTANSANTNDISSKPLFTQSSSVAPSINSTSNSMFNFGSPASTKELSTTESSSTPLFNFGNPAKASTPVANNTTPTPLFAPPATTSSPPPTQNSSQPGQSPENKGSLFSSKYANPTPSGTPETPKASTPFKSTPIQSQAPSNTDSHPMASISPHEIMSETNVTPPAGIGAAELAHFWHDVKVYKLNSQIAASMRKVNPDDPDHAFYDFRSLFMIYISTFAAIDQELVGKTRSQDASAPTQPSSGFKPTNSSSNIFGAAAAKRKAEDSPSTLNEEPSKKSRGNIGPTTPSKWASKPSSDTAKKFDTFLNDSPSKPTANGTTTPEASPIKANLFNAGSTPFKPSANPTASVGSTPFKVTSESQLNSSAGTNSTNATTTAAKPQNSISSSTTDTSKVVGGFGPSGGFKPVGVATGTNMFAAFQNKIQQAEKKRRKDETFDSDEDDEEEWDKNYEEELRAKKAKLQADAAKHAPPPKFNITKTSSTFNLGSKEDAGSEISRSVSPASSILDGPRPTGSHFFSHLSDAGSDAKDDGSDDEDTSKSAKKNGSNGASLFDRVTPRDSSSGTPEDNPGDHTWKPSTPIKFSGASTFNYPAPAASAPPKTGNGDSRPFSLFGAANPKVTLTPAPTTASTGFTFGKPSSALASVSGTSTALASLDTSRASTPLESEAGSTAGEATQDEDEATTAEPTSDLVNFEAATEGHEVLFKSDKAKSLKFIKDEDKRPFGSKAHPWVVQGAGPIAVLKNDETGVCSIFMKTQAGGRVVINTRLSPQVQYDLVGKRARFLVPIAAGQPPDSWLVQFTSTEVAKEFVDVCNENK